MPPEIIPCPMPTNKRFQNLSDQRFNRLLVIRFIGKHITPCGTVRWWWECLCDCGKTLNVFGSALQSDHTVSCGCWGREKRHAATTFHGMTGTPKYRTWKAMVARCTNPNIPNYCYYGGRGIRICSGWRNSFESFNADTPPRPAGTSVDRKDNSGHYSCGHCEQCLKMGWPMNVRWATRKEQMNNCRKCVWIEHSGETHNVQQWCDITGMKPHAIYGRMCDGMSPEQAFKTALERHVKLHPVGPLVQAVLF